MKQIRTLEAAKQRIIELERENADLREQLDYFKTRKSSGRQKHNAKWTAIYNDFVVCYEQGMSIVEIAQRNGLSERSIYRYKEHYDEMQRKKMEN